jgi:hypothetical protein
MISLKELRTVWGTATVTQIARLYKIKPSTVRRLADSINLIEEGPDDDDPRPEEIAERAESVRSTWTPEEESRRVVGGRARREWTPPSIRC